MNGTTAAVLFGSVVVLAGAAAFVMTRPQFAGVMGQQAGQQLAAQAAPHLGPALQNLGTEAGRQLPGVLGNMLGGLGKDVAREAGNLARGALEDLGRNLFGSIFK
ncbi:hypothetical protein ACLEPN_05500 [Myxococcus sp. 1LA]